MKSQFHTHMLFKHTPMVMMALWWFWYWHNIYRPVLRWIWTNREGQYVCSGACFHLAVLHLTFDVTSWLYDFDFVRMHGTVWCWLWTSRAYIFNSSFLNLLYVWDDTHHPCAVQIHYNDNNTRLRIHFDFISIYGTIYRVFCFYCVGFGRAESTFVIVHF